MKTKRKGYVVERKIRKIFESNGWKVIRAGGSLGEADLICIRKGKCIILQIKSTKKKKLYYYDYMAKKIENFPFYLVVDFGYGKIRVLNPKEKVTVESGISLEDFIRKV